jgi:hypothetical protein
MSLCWITPRTLSAPLIRGPVRRGQIANDVIHDQFWTLLQTPPSALYITDPNCRAQVTLLLAVPGQGCR